MRRMQWVVTVLLACASVAAAADGWTGLVVDASHLPIKRARFPRLFDEAGELLYPTSALCDNPDYQGFEGYQPTLTAAKGDKARVGAKPLVLHALALKDKDPLEGSVVLAAADADKVRALNAKGLALLDHDRVDLVIGLAVVATTPAADAKEVPVDAEVVVTFSKPLSDDSARSPLLVTVTAPDGTTGGGSTHWDARAKTATFRPSSSWAKATKYKVVVDKNAEADGLGQLDGGFEFSFATVTPPKEPAATPNEAGDQKKGKK